MGQSVGAFSDASIDYSIILPCYSQLNSPPPLGGLQDGVFVLSALGQGGAEFVCGHSRFDYLPTPDHPCLPTPIVHVQKAPHPDHPGMERLDWPVARAGSTEIFPRADWPILALPLAPYKQPSLPATSLTFTLTPFLLARLHTVL